jgi:uncharacterized protein (TIGR03000 family)
MYSMVLVVALAGAADAPDCHWRCGCYGGYSGGCYGGWGYRGWGGHRYYGGYYPGAYGIYYAGDYSPYYSTVPVAAPANLVVNMPAGAKLTIDGYITSQTSSTRYLVTPDLPAGKEFTYTLVAEAMQDGQLVQQRQTVTVRAGQTTPVTFTFGTTATSANR